MLVVASTVAAYAADGRADQLTADAFADTHTFAAPALAVPRHVPLVTVEVESLHSVNASNQSSLCVVLGRSVSSGDIPERWPSPEFIRSRHVRAPRASGNRRLPGPRVPARRSSEPPP